MVGKIVRLGMVLLVKLPVALLAYLAFNLARIIAPGLLINSIKGSATRMEAGMPSKMINSIKSTEDLGFMFSLDKVKMITMNNVRNILKEAQVGQPSPNPELVDLETRAKLPLVSLAKAGRPLVLNFGSCTCPPFMANLDKFGKLRQNFSEVADFVTIYIAEAHPAERGHFRVGGEGGNYDIDTHANIADRLNAATTLREEAGEALKGCKILVDPMDDRANIAFAALPERLYVVQDGQIVYQGGLGPFDYKISEVEDFLAKNI